MKNMLRKINVHVCVGKNVYGKNIHNVFYCKYLYGDNEVRIKKKIKNIRYIFFVCCCWWWWWWWWCCCCWWWWL